MLTHVRTDLATRLPGPPELLPGCPDAVIDLQTDAGAELVQGRWRYSDARVDEAMKSGLSSMLGGLNLLAIGLLGEMQVRHYHEPSRRAPYSVDRVLRSQNEEHSVSE